MDADLLHVFAVWAARACFFLGALTLLEEGNRELWILRDYVVAPAQVPGSSKIVEHFAMQHLLFPAIGFAIAFAPVQSLELMQSQVWRLVLLALMVMVLIPELIVSFNRKAGDLFRPYPYQVSWWRAKIHMIQIGQFRLNFLHAVHVVFCHSIYVALFVALALAPDETLRWFRT